MSELANAKSPRKMNWELVIDKVVDFILIFVGLYAATALQRYQDDQKEKDEYAQLLEDFQRELKDNQAQHANIEKDLGAVKELKAGAVLGPMDSMFTKFEKEISSDEELVECLHHEFASQVVVAKPKAKPGTKNAHCHELYTAFDHEATERKKSNAPATQHFEPATLSPFYRYEVWELYLAVGARLFKNKELAVKIGEIYNNARVIEKQVADIEVTYNDTFMKQVGRMSASDAELAEIIHDEETQNGLSAQDLAELKDVGEQMKDERFAVVQARSILEMKVRRMKNTVSLTNGEIDEVVGLIDEELKRVKKE